MQDVELFLSLAEIAGVFVGFGALISVRSGAASGRSKGRATGGRPGAVPVDPGSPASRGTRPGGVLP